MKVKKNKLSRMKIVRRTIVDDKVNKKVLGIATLSSVILVCLALLHHRDVCTITDSYTEIAQLRQNLVAQEDYSNTLNNKLEELQKDSSTFKILYPAPKETPSSDENYKLGDSNITFRK